MERKRQRSLPRTGSTSPPRSVKKTGSGSPCVPDMVTRTFDLITSRGVVPYYLLAAFVSFYYCSDMSQAPGPRPMEYVVFKVLPILYLMELVRHPPDAVCPFHDHARRYVFLGLGLTAIADAVLAFDPINLHHWAMLNKLGYICYSVAFYQYFNRSNTKWSRVVVPINIAVTAFLVSLIEDVATCVLVVIYAFFLTVLAFFAVSRLEVCRTGSAYLGWAGVKLFILSDTMLAVNLLVPSLESPVPPPVVAMAYYMGQLGIALSTYTIKLCPDGSAHGSGLSISLDSSTSSVMAASRSAAFE